MRMIWVAKTNNANPLQYGIEQVESDKVSKQPLIKYLIRLQSIMPSKFLHDFLVAFRNWEGQKQGNIVATAEDFDSYVPIFEKLKGLDILVSNVYLKMEKDIARYLTEDDRRKYVDTLLYLALDRIDLVDSEIKLHDIDKLYGSDHFPVNWKYYTSFAVKKKSPIGRIICIFSTRKPQFQGRLILASIGVHDPAYLVEEKKLKYDNFGQFDTKKVDEERKKLEEKREKENKKEDQKKRRMMEWNTPLKDIGKMWEQKKQ